MKLDEIGQASELDDFNAFGPSGSIRPNQMLPRFIRSGYGTRRQVGSGKIEAFRPSINR
jgi:hypothetical protein